MARVTLTKYEYDGTYTGLSITGMLTAGTDQGWAIGARAGHSILRVQNTDAGGAHTITFPLQKTESFLQDITESIPASTMKEFAGWPEAYFRTGQELHIDLEAGQESNLSGQWIVFNPTK